MTTFVSSRSWIEEVSRLLRLAGPLIVNSLSIAGIQFADAVMAGRLGARALAAVAVGASTWFLGFMVCLGLLMAISPIVARHYGAGESALIGRYTRQGIVLGILLGLAVIALAFGGAGPLLAAIGVDPGFRGITIEYVHAMVIGAPAICVFLALRFTTEGIGYTTPMMWLSLFGLVCNVFLNWVFMFGKLGVPAMGAVGAGVASAITMWLMMAALAAYVYLHPRYHPFEIFSRWLHFRWPEMREILVLGMPIAVSITAEAGLFSAVSILVGTLGAEITAAHQIAINFATTTFMVPLALSAATTIRIGHALGAGNAPAARYSGRVGISACAAFMLFSALAMLLFRDAVVTLYTNDPAVREIAISLLLMAAIFQVADGTQVGAAGALRGYKDTRVPMVITAIAYWALAFPLAWLAAVVYRAPPAWIWGGFVVGLSVAAVLLTLRFRRVSRLALDEAALAGEATAPL
jgi:MATE family multidrug resistance protein